LTGNVLKSKAIQNSVFVNTFKDEFYTGIRINKAPNYCSNKMAINKIIRKKKLEKIMDYDNFYNNVKSSSSIFLFKNNSECFPDNLSRNIIRIKPKFQKLSNNSRSCDDIPFINKNLSSKNINSTDDANYDEKNTTENFPNVTSHYYNEKKTLKESTIIEGEPTSENNKDKEYLYHNSVMMTLLPYISQKKNYNKTNCFSIKKKILNEENEVKLYNFATQKMRYHIFEAIDNKSKSVSGFYELEKKIIKLKFFQKIHNMNLDKILLSEKFNIDKKYKYILSLNKKSNNLWIKYRKTINLYLHFLFDKQNEMQAELELLIKRKRENENKIEKLMIQAVKRQKDLEDLVKIRNFLLQVKQKKITQPSYFAPLLHRD
jgi:hypothetical protein